MHSVMALILLVVLAAGGTIRNDSMKYLIVKDTGEKLARLYAARGIGQ